MKLQIFTSKGTKSGEYEFPKNLSVKENALLMAQGKHVYENRSHKGTSKVKTRSEVSLSTRKIYRQKGTGGARHGDKKAPIFVGGGVAHGPNGLKRTLNLSRNLRKVALKMFLTRKVSRKQVGLVTGFDKISKTKDAASLLNNIAEGFGISGAKRILVLLNENNKNAFRSFRNIRNVDVKYWNDLNLMDVYFAHLVVIEKEAIDKPLKEVLVSKSKNTKVVKIPKKVGVVKEFGKKVSKASRKARTK